MEQHPIPQQISSYEFKLVGDMTLKQFGKAAVGIILALLINSTKLFFLIKWPLMLIFAGTGLLLAFVPFQDRPLENWIWSFIKSIYSPTIFVYKKSVNKNWLDLDAAKAESQMSQPKADRPVAEDIRYQIPDLSIKQTAVESQEEIKEKKKIEQTAEVLRGKIEDVVKPLPEIKKEETLQSGVVEEVSVDWREKQTGLELKTEKLEATGKAVFGTIPMPDIPEIPNIIVGMATDGDGKIIEGAIIEIQDEHGNPSRVLKTNQLGQFKTSTQLANGKYLLICDKDGYKFDRVNIDIAGEIIKPIRLIATGI